jgi:hypothetical protein
LTSKKQRRVKYVIDRGVGNGKGVDYKKRCGKKRIERKKTIKQKGEN